MGKISMSILIVSAMLMAFAVPASAVVPAEVTTDVNSCEPTTFSASATGSSVTNQYLTVDDGASVQYMNIPTDGSSAVISVGPFGADTVVSWNVFGGAERDYDQPLWNGYGSPTFSADIAAYAASQGGYSWVIAGVDDPNPFVNWNEVLVPGCSPEVKNECKDGNWEAYGFKNQGQCVRYVETGKDSR